MLCKLAESSCDQVNSCHPITLHELRRQTQHPEASECQRPVPPLVGPQPQRVLGTVHLHDEPRRRSDEVDDVALKHHLPPKPRPQP